MTRTDADRAIDLARIDPRVSAALFLFFIEVGANVSLSPRAVGMKRKSSFVLILMVLLLIAGGVAVAQRGYGRRRGEIRPEMVDRGDVPVWNVEERFKADVFTFVRIRYSSGGWGRGGWGGGRWSTDFPDSDLNFSYRLHELTALEVDPFGKIIELTDEKLFDYPFIYLIEPGGLSFSEEEVIALRRYLYNGGFLMVDDFWGEYEWANFHREIKRVFPDREPIELPLEHEIFHCVYDLKKKPQIPSIGWIRHGRTDDGRPDAPEAHYRGIFDDKGRMMAIVCHNTDLGDGWEREGEDARYFKEFSEKWAYPLGINIVTYAMTH
jgi:hypothetical protein